MLDGAAAESQLKDAFFERKTKQITNDGGDSRIALIGRLKGFFIAIQANAKIRGGLLPKKRRGRCRSRSGFENANAIGMIFCVNSHFWTQVLREVADEVSIDAKPEPIIQLV